MSADVEAVVHDVRECLAAIRRGVKALAECQDRGEALEVGEVIDACAATIQAALADPTTLAEVFPAAKVSTILEAWQSAR
jgi:hypothetical protein